MKRRSHKIITRVIVFLLLGAIVNVAVAWGLVFASQPNETLLDVPLESMLELRKRVPKEFIVDGSYRLVGLGVVYDSVGGHLQRDDMVEPARTFEGSAVAITEGPPPLSFIILRAGWPMKSLSLRSWSLLDQ